MAKSDHNQEASPQYTPPILRANSASISLPEGQKLLGNIIAGLLSDNYKQGKDWGLSQDKLRMLHDLCKKLYEEVKGDYERYIYVIQYGLAHDGQPVKKLHSSFEEIARKEFNINLGNEYRKATKQTMPKIYDEIYKLIDQKNYAGLSNMLAYFKGDHINGLDTRDHVDIRHKLAAKNTKDLKLSVILMEYSYIPNEARKEFIQKYSEVIKSIMNDHTIEPEKLKAYVKCVVLNTPKIEQGEKISVVQFISKNFVQNMYEKYGEVVNEAVLEMKRGDLKVKDQLVMRNSNKENDFVTLFNNEIAELLEAASNGDKKCFGEKLAELFKAGVDILSVVSAMKQNGKYLELAKSSGGYLMEFNKAVVNYGDKETIDLLKKAAKALNGNKAELPKVAIHELEKVSKIDGNVVRKLTSGVNFAEIGDASRGSGVSL